MQSRGRQREQRRLRSMVVERGSRALSRQTMASKTPVISAQPAQCHHATKLIARARIGVLSSRLCEPHAGREDWTAAAGAVCFGHQAWHRPRLIGKLCLFYQQEFKSGQGSGGAGRCRHGHAWAVLGHPAGAAQRRSAASKRARTLTQTDRALTQADRIARNRDARRRRPREDGERAYQVSLSCWTQVTLLMLSLPSDLSVNGKQNLPAPPPGH